ncbi:MAG: glycosyltransferase [Chloroflexota bacterium]
MSDRRLLLLGGAILLRGLNPRTRVLASSIASNFPRVDLVGMENFYSGPPASPFKKAWKGLLNLARCRVVTEAEGGVRRIVVRSLFAPEPLDLLVQDIWYYLNLRRVLDPPYDLGILTDPRYAWLAWMLKRSGCFRRMLYDDCDYHPGLHTNAIARWAMGRREQLCVDMADGITTINHLLAGVRRQQGAKNILVMPNGVELSHFQRARDKRPHPPTLAYIGTLDSAWGVDLVIRAMPELARRIPGVRLLIAGTGPAEKELRALSREIGAESHVVFLGLLRREDVPNVLAEADVGVATSRLDSSFRKYATPLKLVEYMAAGMAVIATRVGQTEIMMQQSQAGALIDFDVAQFVEAAARLFQDQAYYATCIANGSRYAAQYDWNALMQQAHAFMMSIIDGNDVKEALPAA